ncbi:helix-turn-helix domain-containing protein [Craterilacuibacter sinensis]|uniref:DUF4115 domain-containing protein n=1 Tax=Craterilacuibacter sinensis TaxID=2686017 RepID=A0A845BMC4_9NEIS|nr:helix-turn-helix domain-containing protein [Craterilacuibacter sinensis]MXR35601.1 DUF4115 domain-containing protein [Craterilacuibacter sinensis]
MEPADKRIGDTVSVGMQLKRAREAQQLSLGDVAERLKLSVRQLEAIERDDYAFLPGPTFVRGFVRNYARFLNLDSVPLMRLLDEAFPPLDAELAISQQEVQSDTEAGRWGAPRLLLALLAAGAIAAAGWWFSTQPGSEEAPASPGDLSPMLTVEQPAAVDVVTEEVPQASAPAAAKPVASAPAVAVKVEPAVSPESGLRLSSTQESWVSVTDAKGQKLMFGSLMPGEEKTLAGTPPYRVRIGNASHVTVIYKGQPVDMTGKIRGSTATLKLD